MLEKAIKTFGVLLLGIVIGCYGVLIILRCVQLSSRFWDFQFFQLVQFIATVFIAVFVAHYLKNRHSDEQVKKSIFLNIVNDICQTFESESKSLFCFMKSTKRTEHNRVEILLLLRRISNKIGILEDGTIQLGTDIRNLVELVRRDSDDIKSIVTGDKDFIRTNSFSEEVINKVLKEITDVIANLDKIKIRVY